MSGVTLPGTGQVVAVDDDGALKHQRVKLEFGADEVTNTRVSATNPLPVAVDATHAEDSAAADGDKGVLVLAVRRDTPASAVNADSDYATLNVDSFGGLRTTSFPKIRSVSAATMTRPANTTAYAALDAVSDNATAGSVTPLVFALADANDAALEIIQATLRTTDTGALNHSFRLYLYNQLPAVTGGDNAAWSQTLAQGAGLVGTLITAAAVSFSDGVQMFFAPEAGSIIPCPPASGGVNLWGLLQSIDGFTPVANSTTFTFSLQAQQAR